ncbi:MAG TPA: hypothetical protein VN759_06265 [Pseudolysinimonas sp.]|nr:hypothetical protein [Pseudolysinimonas sp.]
MSTVSPPPLGVLHVEFGDERRDVLPGDELSIGRESDLSIDDNPYLHRRFLRVCSEGGLWWLENVGGVLSATVTDAGGQVHASLAPGARLPIVFVRMNVLFGAGSTSYELSILGAGGFSGAPVLSPPGGGDETIGHVPLTTSQRQLIVALAEPLLRAGAAGRGELPGSAEAAERLGWTVTAFNRKLDNVCEKLDRVGVTGLRGGRDSLATNRRLRLVEYAVATRLVTADDLELLGAAS